MQNSLSNRLRQPLFGCLVGSLVLCLVEHTSQAVDFCVKSSVYVEGQEAPIHVNTSYFVGKLVYDIPEDASRQSLLVDREAQSATIYDPVRKATCQVTADEVFRTVAAISVRSTELPTYVRFAAQPKFETDWQPATETLRLMADPMSYSVTTVKAVHAEALIAYRDFADWTARLNATCAGGLPPGARLVLNETLLRLERLPGHVELRRQPEQPRLTSQHRYEWLIDSQATAEIDRLRKQFANSMPIDFVSFRVATPPHQASARR